MQREKSTHPSIGFLLFNFLFALLVASVLGSLSQSHVNLLAIAELTNGISASDWLGTYWFDLLSFGPILALILLPGLLLALLLNSLVQRLLSQQTYGSSAYFLPFLSGAFIFYVELNIINYAAPMPTLIAANRTLPGTLALVSSSGLGAMLFTLLVARKNRSLK